MNYLLINGDSSLKQPQEISVICQDLDSSETTRTQDGAMHRDRIVGGATAKRKIQCKWGGLTMTEMSALHTAMSASSFSLTYPDPYTGSMRTTTVYCGDRTSPVWRNGADNLGRFLWSGLTVNFVEM